MSNEIKVKIQENKELSKGVQSRLVTCLNGIGYTNQAANGLLVSPVDYYHHNSFFVSFSDNKPVFVLKVLDPEKGWDVDENSIRRDHDVCLYSCNYTGLKPRYFAGWLNATKEDSAMVLYPYLGEASTEIKDSERIFEILSRLLPACVRLHTETVSHVFGKSLIEVERKDEQYPEGRGIEMTRFLLNDIENDKLDTTDELSTRIKDVWIPILDAEEKFSLCHNDLTLSNIIVEGNMPTALIDWTYSRWGDPAADLAYWAFLCVLNGKGDNAKKMLEAYVPQYNEKGLHPERTFPFFLAFKCIEFGRFKGSNWVSLGKELLLTDNIDASISLMGAEVARLSTDQPK